MGLDTSHGCWHGAYSAFHTWRTAVAKTIGIPLSLMEGFWHPDMHDAKIPAHIEPAWVRESLHRSVFSHLPLQWESFKPNALHKLLHHSDCEGEIAWEDCSEIADELERILPKLPTGDAGGHIGNWRDKTQTFIDGLRLAVTNKENVDFH